MMRFSSFIPPLVLATLVGTVAAAIGDLASPPGGLQIASAVQSYGNALVRTGGASYPREALDADNVRVRVAAPAQRIISQSPSIDEFLYSVVPANRIVGVSPFAFSERDSNVLALASAHNPIIATDLERVLTVNPDLMIVSSTGRADFASLGRAANLPVYRMYTMFTRLDEVAESIRLTGYLTGNDEAARVQQESYRYKVAQAIAMRPANVPKPRILAISGALAYGSETLLNDIIEKLGATNVAAEGGLKGYDQVNSETYLRWDPDWIITNSDFDSADSVKAKLLADPAIGLTKAAKSGHIVVLNNKVFFPLSPFTSELVTELAKTLYPGRGGGR